MFSFYLSFTLNTKEIRIVQRINHCKLNIYCNSVTGGNILDAIYFLFIRLHSKHNVIVCTPSLLANSRATGHIKGRTAQKNPIQKSRKLPRIGGLILHHEIFTNFSNLSFLF